MPVPTPRPSQLVLNQNLAALRSVQPAMHERVHWPVEGDHLGFDARGEWTYRHRSKCLPIALDERAVQATLESVQADGTEPCFVFGLGLGETLRALLHHAPQAPVIAWDRDPWILRQVLSVHDWSADLLSGRLRFALNADLVHHARAFDESHTVWHPILTGIYQNERRWFQDGAGNQRALLCTGGLFVDSFGDLLRNEGYSVFSFDVKRLAVEELELVLQSVRPDVVASINLVNGLAEFCESQGVDSIVWEIDPATDALVPLSVPAPRTHVFSYRRANVAAIRSAGYEHVHYLPLAADTERRRPLELTDAERTRYGAAISFVGSSLSETAPRLQAAFVEQLASYRPDSRAQDEVEVAAILRVQRADLTDYRIPELLEAHFPGFRGHALAQGWQDPAALLGEVAGAAKRADFIRAFGDRAIHVWGDEGWAACTDSGALYRGPALHETELPLIYNASTIQLDIGRVYQDDIVTMRIFDILACGGFVLAEHSDALAELFEIDVEVVSYRGLDELRAKVDHYLAHPEEARRIAERGRAAVLERHDMAQRVRRMLQSLHRSADVTASAAGVVRS